MNFNSFDSAWEYRYKNNPKYRNHYPWSSIVSFVFENKPKHKDHNDINILEVGCGNGNNLWFAAREKFNVFGIDGSQTAIDYAVNWFKSESLNGDFRVGDYSNLPYDDDFFDLVLDRSALTFCGSPTIENAIKEIWRVLKFDGTFIFNPLSDRCSSFDGIPDQDLCYRKVHLGTIKPGTQVRFYSLLEIRQLFHEKWFISKMILSEQSHFHTVERTTHAEWQVEVKKIGPANGI